MFHGHVKLVVGLCWAWWAWPTPPAADDERPWSRQSQKWQLHQHEARAILSDTFLCDCVVEIFDLVKRQLHNGADARVLAGDDLPRLLASCRMWEWVVEHPDRDDATNRKLRRKRNQLLEACRGGGEEEDAARRRWLAGPHRIPKISPMHRREGVECYGTIAVPVSPLPGVCPVSESRVLARQKHGVGGEPRH